MDSLKFFFCLPNALSELLAPMSLSLPLSLSIQSRWKGNEKSSMPNIRYNSSYNNLQQLLNRKSEKRKTISCSCFTITLECCWMFVQVVLVAFRFIIHRYSHFVLYSMIQMRHFVVNLYVCFFHNKKKSKKKEYDYMEEESLRRLW